MVKVLFKVREHGVGFAVKNTLLGSIVLPSFGSERITSLQRLTVTGNSTLISAYATTLDSPPMTKMNSTTTSASLSAEFLKMNYYSSLETLTPA